MKESDLRQQIGGSLQIPTGRAATEALRLSMMLNKMDGHHITLTQAKGAVIGRDKKVYIHDVATLKSYLTQKYGAPETATSVSALRWKRGILVLDPSDGVGSVGLWNGSKMHQMPDHSRQPNVAMNLWTLPNSECFNFFLINVILHQPVFRRRELWVMTPLWINCFVRMQPVAPLLGNMVH